MKPLLKVISVPLTLLVLYISLFIVWKLFDLPDQEALVIIIKNYFATYGLPFLFVSAILEGFLILGSYFPGGIVIFLSVILAGHDIPKIITIILLVATALTIAYSGDYYLGKVGWYKLFLKFGLKSGMENAEKKLNKHVGKAIFYSYWDTTLASIMATSAGVLKVPYTRFISYSVFSIIFWNTFWSTIIYFAGESILKMSPSYMLTIIGLWACVLLGEHYISKKYKYL